MVGALVGGSVLGPSRVEAQGAAVAAADQVNLRVEPGTWAAVVGVLALWQPINVLAGPTADGWYQIESGGLTGWSYGGFLEIGGAPGWAPWPEPVPVAAGGAPVVADPAAAAAAGIGGPVGASGAAWVATDALNVRAAPSDQAGILDVVAGGQEVTITGDPVEGFFPIAHWAGQGWVWGGFLDFSGPVVTPAEHWVDVDRSSQTVTLYEGEQPVASYWAAMGIDGSDDGFFATAVGTYYVYEKYGDLSWTNWGGAWVRDWVGFDPNRLNGFHSYSMDGSGNLLPDAGAPTGGCVALAPEAADHLFAFVGIGTRVEVHW
jgi:uncharacterized protein YraI